jgi:hypothetical protein
MLWFHLLACAPDLTPSWAWDPIWIEPDGEGIHGFQTWQVYGPRWADRPKDRFYTCAVVVELAGQPVECDAAPGCGAAWDLELAPLETDCAGALAEDPLFLSLRRLAVGGPVADDEAAWPGLTSAGFADYGGGWIPHGQAYAEALDYGGAGQLGWDGQSPFLFVPEGAVPLAEGL